MGGAAVKQGQVKAIAMLARERTALLPDLPTADEQGLKDFDVSAWNAILLPRSAPPETAGKLQPALPQGAGQSSAAQPVRRYRPGCRSAGQAQPGIPAQVH